MSITFETKVWERDWEIMLETRRLKDMVERCHHAFDRRILYINNVNEPARVERAAKRLIQQDVIDDFVHVDQYAAEALHYFGLSKDKLGKGYYYSIAELVSLYLTKTKYLLHFSGDSIVLPGTPTHWLQDGLKILEQNENVKVFNLTWNNCYAEAKKESDAEDEDFYFGYGFSDQMYLVRTEDFRQCIYEHDHPASARYPAYGGELFEKRVDSWMRNEGCLRATYKHGSYMHKNYPKRTILKKIAILCNQPDWF